MLKKSFSFVFLVVAACGDSANPDVSFQFRETSLRQLRGVEIGMPARQLKTARPNATFEPSTGLRETIPSYSVSYRFRSADGAATDVAPNDRLSALFMSRQFESFDAATLAWRQQLRTLAEAKRPPDLCERFPDGAVQSRWFSNKNLTLAIGSFPRHAANASIAPRLVLALGPNDEIKQPAGATPMVCPST